MWGGGGGGSAAQAQTQAQAQAQRRGEPWLDLRLLEWVRHEMKERAAVRLLLGVERGDQRVEERVRAEHALLRRPIPQAASRAQRGAAAPADDAPAEPRHHRREDVRVRARRGRRAERAPPRAVFCAASAAALASRPPASAPRAERFGGGGGIDGRTFGATRQRDARVGAARVKLGDDERHAQALVVHAGAVLEVAVISERLGMVAEHDQQRRSDRRGAALFHLPGVRPGCRPEYSQVP